MIPTPCIQPGCPRMAVGGPRAPRCHPCQRGWDRHRALTRGGYHGVHTRLLHHRGPASNHRCACGSQAAEWAYDGQDPNERVSGSITYSRNLARYIAKCVPCHREFDRAKRTDRK